ncbi:MAG: PleD family two-component system response regulator [Hyphomicrobiaceae bacterium]|nr:PleD family two-component system response regulator [Hyphomicrobiaceae bacterium]
MTARVLVVDDIPTNVKLLEARLTAEYFDVVPAYSGQQAIDICHDKDIDIVLLDVMMPDMDGFEVCRHLKSDRRTQHIPIVMITALDQPSDRVQGLESGADDFLTKPPEDIQLLARVKSLVRLKILTDELRARARTSQQLAAEDGEVVMAEIGTANGRILLVDDDALSAERFYNLLSGEHQVTVMRDPTSIAMHAAMADFEVALISMALKNFDPLRVVSQLRTLERTRGLPIILVAEPADRARVVRGLDLGVNDFIYRPIERHELVARVRTQIRRQRYAAELRESVNTTLAMAVTDELTGLYNRRYFDRHVGIMLEKAREQDRALAVMMLDIDHFKRVNDQYGHDAGDMILKEFSTRVQRNIRGVDLACRYGGEEFVVLMPDISQRQAEAIGERIRSAVGEQPFDTGGGQVIPVTVSVGLAISNVERDTPDMLLKRADVALYRAKEGGRNRVIFDAA